MKLTQIKRKVAISSTSWATDTWTINFGAAHYLLAADTFKFVDPVTTQEVTLTVAGVTDADTVTVSSTNSLLKFPSFVFLENYGTGATGAQDTFTLSFNDTVSGLVHVVSNGTATVTAKAQGSLDQTHWVDHGTATAVTAGSQLEIPVTKPYPYMRLNFTVAVGSAGGGANTIKAYRAGC
jgi:hypothetical protein